MSRVLARTVIFAAACSAITIARADAPTRSEQHVQRAAAYARGGNDVLAEAHYREAVHADPRNLAAYLGLAQMLVRGERGEEALEVVRVGLGIDASHEGLAELASTLLLEAGALREALRPMSVACRSRRTVACFARLADVAERAGAHPEALTALRRARALDQVRSPGRDARIAMLEALLDSMLTTGAATRATTPACPPPAAR